MSWEPVELAGRKTTDARSMAYCVRWHKAAVRSTLEITGSGDLALALKVQAGSRVRLDVDARAGTFRLLPVTAGAPGGLKVFQRRRQWRVRTCYDGALTQLFPLASGKEPTVPPQCGLIPLQVLSASHTEGLIFELRNPGGAR